MDTEGEGEAEMDGVRCGVRGTLDEGGVRDSFGLDGEVDGTRGLGIRVSISHFFEFLCIGFRNQLIWMKP